LRGKMRRFSAGVANGVTNLFGCVSLFYCIIAQLTNLPDYITMSPPSARPASFAVPGRGPPAAPAEAVALTRRRGVRKAPGTSVRRSPAGGGGGEKVAYFRNIS
jgi:hypothetical protein